MRREEEYQELVRLRARIERLQDLHREEHLRGWPCGICGTPKVLECPVCSKAEVERLRAEAALWECSECGWHHDVDCTHKARIDAALALHKQNFDGKYYFCEADNEDWPCPTVKALKGG